MKHKVRKTITICPDLWRKIQRVARIDGRSASGYVSIVLKRFIEGEERREGK